YAEAGEEGRAAQDRLAQIARDGGNVEEFGGGWRLRDLVRALRPHQWVKNVLVFLPMIAGHAFSLGNVLWSLLAFLAFGLVASAVYVLNDLVDLQADRRHPTKRNRPFASGALSLAAGTWMFPILLAAGLGLAAVGGAALFGVMAFYTLTTTAYSLKLKGTLGADILLLAVLYTLRIIAGAAATGIAPSMWLLSFSVFLFLSLAAVKRLSELVHIEAEGDQRRAKGRAYTVEDRPVVAMIATSAGFLSVLVLALYIDSPEVSGQYARPEILWGLGLGLLYWISRTVLLAHRGHVDQDPVVFALTDRVSQVTGLVFVLVFIAAVIG
ncbi:MAG: UbiA family prenyltransferase, partial [Maritimibacter sp.]|nr:UbiA family prenyltransferase [Maritimibacter sp.]